MPVLMNRDLRKTIARMVHKAKDGHIPSAFSIVDILSVLYGQVLKYDAKNPQWPDRDYFVLSKGHGCVAFYSVLEKHGFITRKDLDEFCTKGGILGEHPDANKVPGAEASTGSLGHGLPFAAGIALGLRIKNKSNKVFVIVGDGECHEGTVWEAANVAANRQLGNLCVIVDWNGSAATLMPLDNMPAKWEAFGWKTMVIDGHDEADLKRAFSSIEFKPEGIPTAIIAKTVKGKGVPFLEGHGIWHHRVPSPDELKTIEEALS